MLKVVKFKTNQLFINLVIILSYRKIKSINNKIKAIDKLPEAYIIT